MPKKSDGEKLAKEFSWYKYTLLLKKTNQYSLVFLVFLIGVLLWTISLYFTPAQKSNTSTPVSTEKPALIK